MKKYILSILLSGAFMFTACSDFLDEVPKGNITSEGYYKTAQHAISATNAIYDYLAAVTAATTDVAETTSSGLLS